MLSLLVICAIVALVFRREAVETVLDWLLVAVAFAAVLLAVLLVPTVLQ